MEANLDYYVPEQEGYPSDGPLLPLPDWAYGPDAIELPGSGDGQP